MTTNSVKVVVTVKGVVYVGTEVVEVLPSWVEQDLTATTGLICWKRRTVNNKINDKNNIVILRDEDAPKEL